MGAEEDVLTLVLKAKDMASREVSGLGETLGGLVSPMTLVATGVGALVGGLGLAVKAAAAEQKGIARLDSALEANVKGWDGNTDAIEAQIAKREDLAFSDDSLRASLATLVTATGDVTKAQDLQAVAMDLARAKGVDLETASEAVARATQGSTKELKAMGLEIDDSATASQNLAKIQAATAGQAQAYAGTMNAKWETFQNKLGDVVESIGGALLPVVEGLMDFLLTTGIPAFQGIVDLLGPIFHFVGDIAGAVLKVLIPALKGLIDVVKGIIGFFLDLIDAIHDFLGLDSQARDRAGKPITAGEHYAGHLASGGQAPPGWTWTGETGPELVHFPAPADVLSHRDSMAAISSGPQLAPAIVPVMVDGREIARVVDDRLFYALNLAIPRSART
jgi:hypothetical protein